MSSSNASHSRNKARSRFVMTTPKRKTRVNGLRISRRAGQYSDLAAPSVERANGLSARHTGRGGMSRLGRFEPPSLESTALSLWVCFGFPASCQACSNESETKPYEAFRACPEHVLQLT